MHFCIVIRFQIYLLQMATQHNQPASASLPPGCLTQAIQYTLTLTQVSLQLIQITPKPTILKIQMWGLPQESRLDQANPLVFNVHTSSSLFRQYLRDMKVAVVRMCDSRNNQELGSGLINWPLFLRKLDLNGSPFIDDNFNITLMVYNYKKKQIAEITITAKWATYKKTQPNPDAPTADLFSSKYALKDQQKSKMEQNIRTGRQTNQQQLRRITIDNDSLSNQQIDSSQKQLKIGQQEKRKDCRQRIEATGPIQSMTCKEARYPDRQYELEKTQLRLEAQQLLTISKGQEKGKSQSNGNMITLRIDELRLLKPNIFIEYLDVSVTPRLKKSQEDQQVSSRKYLRAFGAGKSNSFTVEVSAKSGDLVEVEAPKLGKAVLQVKQVQQRGTIKASIIGKMGKVGTINATKLYQPRETNLKQLQSLSIPEKKAIEKMQQLDYAEAHRSPATPAFMLVRILNASHSYLADFQVAIKNTVFSKPYPSLAIIPLGDLGSIFAIEMRNSDNQTVGSILIEDHPKMAIIQSGLGCIVLRSGRLQMKDCWIKAELMLGTMKQINFELSRQNQTRNLALMKQVAAINPADTQMRGIREMGRQKLKSKESEQQEIEQITKKQSMSSEKIRDDMDVPRRKYRRTNRKIYTQMLGMNESAAIEPSEYRMQENNQELQDEETEPVFLVEVLSRFLHALPAEKLGQMPPTNVEEFFNLLDHFLANRQEKQLADIVVEMFVDDAPEEGQPSRLEYEEFLKCLKSYHNFLELWWRIRVDILNELIKSEPEYEAKINRYSELGTISKQAIWKKIFPKITNSELKLIIDKALRLNSGVTVPSAFLIEELKKVQNHPNQLPRQASPDLIIDLGKLVKQTVEQILEGSGLTPPPVPEDRVNIRVMCDTLNKTNICLSYWEALMLIEELKGWYNIDLDCNEGIVSGSVVEIWLKSVLNRSKVQIKMDDPKQPQPKPALNQFKAQTGLQLSSNPSQKLKPLENKSMAKSELNEEQIENIANLLRDNDNFRMGTFTSQKPGSKVFNGNTIYNLSNNKSKHKDNTNKILNDDILNDSSIQDSLSEQIPHRLPQACKYLHVSIKSVKLKSQAALSSPFRLQLKLHSPTHHYFLCRSLEQALNLQLVEELTENWHHKCKGLAIQFLQPTSIQANQGIKNVALYGILLTDQILELNQGKKTKTVVLYGGKEIVGKITLQLTVSSEKPSIFYCERNTNISMEVWPDSKHEAQWQFFSIRSKATQLVSGSQPIDIKVEKGTKCIIPLNGMFYKEVLVVVVDGVGCCTVPLEQLYFKGAMEGEYPVLNEDALFMGNLSITLCNKECLLNNPSTGMMNKQEQVTNPESTQSNRYLIILDSICSINVASNTSFCLSILSNVFIKEAYNRGVLYRSPFYIEHEHRDGAAFAITKLGQFSEENYFIIQQTIKQKAVTIDLEYEGRPVAVGDRAIKLREETAAKSRSREIYTLRYVGNAAGPLLLAISFRIMVIPQLFKKYNPNRIFKALSKFHPAVLPASTDYAELLIRNNPKLTIMEQKLVTQLMQISCPIRTNYPLGTAERNQLVSELIFADSAHTGHLPIPHIQQIVQNVVGKETCAQILRELQNNFIMESRQAINYMCLLELVWPDEQSESEDNQWGSNIGSQVVENINRIHREIKEKYAV